MHDDKDGGSGGRALNGIESLEPADLTYAAAFKIRCLELLKEYRADLSAKQGKRVSLAQMRDMIMAAEDEAESGQRSSLVSTEDLKGWCSEKSTHLPSDMKFEYVLRFLRSLEAGGPGRENLIEDL